MSHARQSGFPSWGGAAILALCAAPAALAQTAPEAVAPAERHASRWERTVEVNGNYLYGNTEQAILGVRTGVLRNDSTLAVRVDTRYTIGVRSGTDGQRTMDRRSWLLSANADYRQYGRESPFVFASLEESLELRVDRRLSLGIGEKVSFIRNDTTRFDASLGLIGEHSRLPKQVPAGDSTRPVVVSSLARLSGRIRYRRALTHRFGFDQVAWYKPELAHPSHWLGSSSSIFSYVMTRRTGLTVTLYNEFDSLAKSRGVRSNSAGQILIGASSKF
ncbi:MAG: DUF481 domain-containing protein [Gemmatimonadaceae bacterium]|nr:DUF481 domain-containing protein [Gemmatimonadaceae bacterium]